MITKKSARVSALLLLAMIARGQSPEEAASLFLSATALTNPPPVEGIADAQAYQEKFVAALEASLGAPVGYKAALTNPRAQEIFGASGPLSGVLLEKMLLTNGATIKADAGAVLMMEADLLVRVGSTDFITAETDAELLRTVDALIPFLEFPDLGTSSDVPRNAVTLKALNAGARLGVLGEPILMEGIHDWPQRLAFFRVVIKTDADEWIGDGSGGNLLGNPMTALRWLRDDIKASGRTLKPGDLLSLGSLTSPVKATPGTCVTASYYNLALEGVPTVKACVAESMIDE